MSTTPVTVHLTDKLIEFYRRDSADTWVEGSPSRLLAEAVHALPDPTPERTEYALYVINAKGFHVAAVEKQIHAGDLRDGDRLWVDGEWRAVEDYDVGGVVSIKVNGSWFDVDALSSLIVRPAGVS